MKAILRNNLYISSKYIDDNSYLMPFTHKVEDIQCNLCKHKDKNECFDCPFEEGTEILTYKEYKNVYSFSRGNLGKLYKIFKDFNIINETSCPRFKYDLKFTSCLWPNQKITIDKWMKSKYGIIMSPPRSGKTVMACYIAVALGVKTLILTHQSDLLDQFYNTFEKCTNLNTLKSLNERVVSLTNCREDISDIDICLTTYQSFIRDKGKDFLNKIVNSFGLVIVDECHVSGAECFRKVVNIINSRYRLGLSATPERKDNLQCLVYDIIGPVKSKGVSNEMMCNVHIHNTEYKVPNFSMWQTFIKRLSENNKRNNLICDMVERDIKDGRYILIVSERKNHIDFLVKTLNDRGITAASFDGRMPKSKRQKFLDTVRDGKIDVLVAMRKMMKLGIDLPILDTYYHIVPMAYGKNYYQEMSRVRTPYPDLLKKKLGKNKPIPTIRIFKDYGHGAVYACFNIIDKVHCEQNFNVKSVKSVNNDNYRYKVKKIGW